MSTFSPRANIYPCVLPGRTHLAVSDAFDSENVFLERLAYRGSKEGEGGGGAYPNVFAADLFEAVHPVPIVHPRVGNQL